MLLRTQAHQTRDAGRITHVVRPGELRAAEWKEFDINRAERRIPAERMKMCDEHMVPLFNQALQIIRELHAMTGDVRYVFPSRAQKRGR